MVRQGSCAGPLLGRVRWRSRVPAVGEGSDAVCPGHAQTCPGAACQASPGWLRGSGVHALGTEASGNWCGAGAGGGTRNSPAGTGAGGWRAAGAPGCSRCRSAAEGLMPALWGAGECQQNEYLSESCCLRVQALKCRERPLCMAARLRLIAAFPCRVLHVRVRSVVVVHELHRLCLQRA